MHLTVDDLYSDIFSKCVENNIELKLFNKRSHMGCGGWVRENEFVCCFKHPSFLDILVHESCHLDQMLDKSSIWYHPHLKDGDDMFDIWNPTLKKRHPIKSKRAFKKTCELEIDCDIRSVKKIKKYNLPIDLKEYIQSSNCYHAAYYYFWKYSCFYHKDHIPYEKQFLDENFSIDGIDDINEIWCENKALGEFIKKKNKPL